MIFNSYIIYIYILYIYVYLNFYLVSIYEIHLIASDDIYIIKKRLDFNDDKMIMNKRYFFVLFFVVVINSKNRVKFCVLVVLN